MTHSTPLSRRPTGRAAALLILAATLTAPSFTQELPERFTGRGLPLQARTHPQTGETVLVGRLEVPEDRTLDGGRRIALHLLVVPARSEDPRPDPVFYLAGGPGQGATTAVGGMLRSWMREDRDIVLVDQRGTGGSNPLRVDMPGGAGDPQGYLTPLLREDVFRHALAGLSERADLTKYTTPIAMDDLDAVRAALGYERINLIGGSYGTRAALVYMRRHPEHVRCAVLDGVAPIAFKNPLFHARSAEEGFETLRKECLEDPAARAAFGDLRESLDAVLARLEEEPARVTLGEGERAVEVTLTRDAFAEAFRVMTYYQAGNRRAPLLLHRAAEGDLRPFAELALASNRALREALAFGMLMSVTNAEDLPRITEEEIVRETAGTYLGDVRVRAQLAIGVFWPRAKVPGYGAPVSVDVPTLLLSGTHDPVTPPRWGAEAASHLPESLHVVVNGCHGVGGHPRVARLIREFLDRGSVEGLDLDGLDEVRMPPVEVPEEFRSLRDR